MVFQCINIRQVPWNLAHVNAWKTMFDPYNKMLLYIFRNSKKEDTFWLSSDSDITWKFYVASVIHNECGFKYILPYYFIH